MDSMKLQAITIADVGGVVLQVLRPWLKKSLIVGQALTNRKIKIGKAMAPMIRIVSRLIEPPSSS